jgi:hypothetical protein
MEDDRSNEELKDSKKEVVAGAREKLPKAGRGARDDGVDDLVCWRLIDGC